MSPESVLLKLLIDNARRCWEGFSDVSEGLRMLALPWLSAGYPLSFKDSLKLVGSKVRISRARLSFSLFYLSMNNPRVASKILLPPYMTVYNVN